MRVVVWLVLLLAVRLLVAFFCTPYCSGPWWCGQQSTDPMLVAPCAALPEVLHGDLTSLTRRLLVVQRAVVSVLFRRPPT